MQDVMMRLASYDFGRSSGQRSVFEAEAPALEPPNFRNPMTARSVQT